MALSARSTSAMEPVTIPYQSCSLTARAPCACWGQDAIP